MPIDISCRQTETTNVLFQSLHVVFRVREDLTEWHRVFSLRNFVARLKEQTKTIDLHSSNGVFDQFVREIRRLMRPDLKEFLARFFQWI